MRSTNCCKQQHIVDMTSARRWKQKLPPPNAVNNTTWWELSPPGCVNNTTKCWKSFQTQAQTALGGEAPWGGSSGRLLAFPPPPIAVNSNTLWT